ncbi:MAG: DUF2007 domain-containing protein [Chthoniobacterales bacterium]
MITIRTFTDSIEAGVVASFLKDNEIEAVLLDENSGGLGGFNVPVRLQVDEDKAEEANKLLHEFDDAPLLPPNASDSVSE